MKAKSVNEAVDELNQNFILQSLTSPILRMQ